MGPDGSSHWESGSASGALKRQLADRDSVDVLFVLHYRVAEDEPVMSAVLPSKERRHPLIASPQACEAHR